jgi:hypothetical protein
MCLLHRLLHLLHEADPTENHIDSDEMLNLEGEPHCIFLLFFLGLKKKSSGSGTGSTQPRE